MRQNNHTRMVVLAAQTLLIWAAILTIVQGDLPASPPEPPASSVEIQRTTQRSISTTSTFLPRDSSNPEFAQEVVERINLARWENDLPPLKRVDGLDAASAYHSQDMAVDRYFAHDSYNRVGGNLVYERPWYERVGDYYSNWSRLGECIAAGQTTPQGAVQAWLNSQSGHREILLSSAYTEIGSGHYACTSQGCQYSNYWTTDYGVRNDIYPLIINLEAAVTTDREVSLYIYGEGWVNQMSFSNDGVNWTDWEDYSPTRTWTLPCGTGEKTVYVRIKDGSEIKQVSDLIVLDGEEHRLGVGTNQVFFLYSIQDQQMFPRPAQEISVENTGVACEGLEWQVTEMENWFALSPISSTTPSTVTVTPTDFEKGVPGTYTGTGAIAATQPSGAGGSPQTISVQLIVAEKVYQTFLPLVARGD